MGRPELRAAVLKQHVAALADLPEAAAARARAGLGAEGLRAIDRARGSDWLPASLSVALTSALAQGSPDLVRELGRAVAGRVLATALVRPIYVAARGMFGARPAALIRFMPQSWGIVSRNCGGLVLESHGPTHARLVHVAIPPELRDFAYLHGTAGILESFAALCGATEAQVDVEWRAPADRAAYDLRWR